MAFTTEDRDVIADYAKRALLHAVREGSPLRIHLSEFSDELRAHRSCFVTLKKDGELRGCIGSLEGPRPLIEDVVHNAYAAALYDNRFSQLTESELDGLEVHISVLSNLEQIQFTSEEDLCSQLRPGVDGLVLREGGFQGSFLPVMWEKIPDPKTFIRYLKEKAGLPRAYWSETMEIFRYAVEEQVHFCCGKQQ